MACFSSRVPPVAVYLVKFCRKASIAACLMFSGVGKSGSPAPKSTRFTPPAFSFSALITTAAVDDTEILEIRSENCISSCLTLLSSPKLSTAFQQEAAQDPLPIRHDEKSHAPVAS